MGLFFSINDTIHLPGESVLISDVGPQPANRGDPGTTLVCNSTNVNMVCCRKSDNDGVTTATAGRIGEWYYPDGTVVPRPGVNVVDFARVGDAQQIRLAREVSDSTPTLGVYMCEVPLTNGSNVSATITLFDQRKLNTIL